MVDTVGVTEFDRAEQDEQVAVKVLGGLGCRNHIGDTNYALSINELLFQAAGIDASDVECMIFLAKTRNVPNVNQDIEQDSFNLIGGVRGSELELTALHAMIAASIRKIRAQVAERIANGKVEDKANNG